MIKVLRPVRLGGKLYGAGEILPEGVLNRNRIPVLERLGKIKEVEDLQIKTAGVKTETKVIKSYSKEKLSELKKTELTEIAREKGLEINGKETVKELISAITGNNKD